MNDPREREPKHFYILSDAKGREPMLVDLKTWWEWLRTRRDDNFHRVSHDIVHVGSDYGQGEDIEVSTIFLMCNHAFRGGPPLLFETMAFGPCGVEHLQHRYETWAQAEEGHANIVAALKALTPTDRLANPANPESEHLARAFKNTL